MLIKSCEIASGECMNKPNKSVTIARAIIRIGDAARNANDYSLLGALHEMVEQLSQNGVKDTDVDMDLLSEYVEAADGCDYCRAGDGKPSVDELTTKINQQLACRGQAQVEASDQSVLKFEPLVHLVTAAYAKNDNGTTSGLSIALVVNSSTLGLPSPARQSGRFGGFAARPFFECGIAGLL